MIDWRHWHNEPILVGGLILLGWLYAVFTGPLRERLASGAPYPRNHAIRYYAGLILFYLAVGSPLDQIGERFLLSAHMVQHQLLIYGAAVLCLLGLPSWLVAPITDRPQTRGFWKLAFHPIICGLIYVVTLSVWHAPALYDWALRDKNVHVIEHLMFFGAALFYWWPILSPSKAFPPLRYGSQMIYLLAVTTAMTPVFAFIAFSDNVLYPTYEYAPRLADKLGPMDDQLLGAALMKITDICVTITTMLIAFYRWYQASERKAPKAD
jgi:putative membrane protein